MDISTNGKNAISYAKAIDFINKELEAGRPVIVGIDHQPGGGGNENTNAAIDHWITIVGKTNVAGENRFLVYENAAPNQSKGTPYFKLNYIKVTGKEMIAHTYFSFRKDKFNITGVRGVNKSKATKTKLRPKF